VSEEGSVCLIQPVKVELGLGYFLRVGLAIRRSEVERANIFRRPGIC
jgi:hypothetical protein